MSVENLLYPGWPAPANVRAAVTTRLGGKSKAPYDSFNLAEHVSDSPTSVAVNRSLLCKQLGLEPEQICWLRQTHSSRSVVWSLESCNEEADGSYSHSPDQVCCVMTADCLPVLFCDREGRQVAAAHAGWRGLLGGILENTLACFEPNSELLVWLGPAIGPKHFEVGPEVYEAYLSKSDSYASAFQPGRAESKYMMDIYLAARICLRQQGVTNIFGGNYCTYDESHYFYSYRRDGNETGRMASLIWISKRSD